MRHKAPENIIPLLDISIHAPVKGATNENIIDFYYRSYFNPRTREGCDQKISPEELANAIISIHAPVKGATFFIVSCTSYRN